MKLLAALVLLASAGLAGVITNPTTAINWDGGSINGTLATSLTNSNSGGYTLSTTACFDAFCPGQGTPGEGPNFTVNDPITMRGTAMTLMCTSDAGCGAADIFLASHSTR